MKRIISILKFEFDLYWRPALIGIIFSVLFILHMYNLRSSSVLLEKHNVDRIYITEIIRSLYTESYILIPILSYIYAKSVSNPISTGLIKTILSYPITRKCILTIKLLLGYSVLFLAGIFPLIYSWIIYVAGYKALISVVMVYALKLLFFVSLAILISLTVNEALSSFIEVIFLLYLIENLPSLLIEFGLKELAKVVAIDGHIYFIYIALSSEDPLNILIKEKTLFSFLLYIVISMLLLYLSFIIFKKKDLD